MFPRGSGETELPTTWGNVDEGMGILDQESMEANLAGGMHPGDRAVTALFVRSGAHGVRAGAEEG